MAESRSLYGTKQLSKTKVKEISSSTTLAFSSQLASLISKDAPKLPTADRDRQPKTKSDLFANRHKKAKKRAAADLVEDISQTHQTKLELGELDSAALHRSKRRMEEKARLYAAMKRGDYVAPQDGRDERGLVDFDRKWAEREASGADDSRYDTSSGSSGSDSEEEIVDFTDEFGRQRRGTRTQAAREERKKRIQAIAAGEEEKFSARPNMPSNILYGDTVQYAAFNPDADTAQKMEDIAKKRDRPATPPPDSHYDASAEVRTKGTGFYQFSAEKEVRAREMDALTKERVKTERVKAEREHKKQERKRELEERKQQILEQKGKKQADRFLDELGADIGGGASLSAATPRSKN